MDEPTSELSTVPDLIIAFQNLTPPQIVDGATDRFSAVPIPEYPRHRVGKDGEGQPCIMISVQGPSRPGPPIVLENLSLQHGIECRITKPSGDEEVGTFAVLRCTNADRDLEEHFLGVGGSLIASLGQDPSADQVRSATEQLVELFRAMDAPPTTTVVGFWAELLFMAEARNPAELVSSWHALPTDRYDFSNGPQRIEVKAAIGGQREHHFSLDQLTTPLGTTMIVVSFVIQRAGGGTSLEDLLGRVRSRLSDSVELQLRVDRVSADILGRSWREAYTQRFDLESARRSLEFFRGEEVPSPDPEVPPDVHSIRFISDLSRMASMDRETLANLGGIIAAAVPR
jgi:hypothetical protein